MNSFYRQKEIELNYGLSVKWIKQITTVTCEDTENFRNVFLVEAKLQDENDCITPDVMKVKETEIKE